MIEPPRTLAEALDIVDRIVAVERVLPWQHQLVRDIVAEFYIEHPAKSLVVRRPMHEPGHSRTPAVLATVMLLIDCHRFRARDHRVEHTLVATGRRMAKRTLNGVRLCMRALDANFDAGLLQSNVEVLATEHWHLTSIPNTRSGFRGIGGDLIAMGSHCIDNVMLCDVILPLLEHVDCRLLVDAQVPYHDENAGRALELVSTVILRDDGHES